MQSQWSFAQFRLPGSEKSPTRSIAAFGGVRTARPSWWCARTAPSLLKRRFDPVKGGECTREDWQRYLGATRMTDKVMLG